MRGVSSKGQTIKIITREKERESDFTWTTVKEEEKEEKGQVFT